MREAPEGEHDPAIETAVSLSRLRRFSTETVAVDPSDRAVLPTSIAGTTMPHRLQMVGQFGRGISATRSCFLHLPVNRYRTALATRLSWNRPLLLNAPSPSSSREVAHSRSLASYSSNGRLASAVLYLVDGGNARFRGRDCHLDLSARIVSARGWQQVRLVPRRADRRR